MEIAQERLEREFGLNLIITAPTVAYRARTTGDETLMVDNPSRLPPENALAAIEEPFILASIHVPEEYLGAVMGICKERRGVQRDLRYAGHQHVILQYEMPLAEIFMGAQSATASAGSSRHPDAK